MPAKPRLSLALNVTNTGNSLRLSWDRQASRDAGHAVLWIKDGQESQRFELDSKQLSEGSVAYWPRTSDVNFRLELLSPGAGVAESVRAIGGPSTAQLIVRAPAEVAVEPRPVPAAKAPATPGVEAPPAFMPSPKPSRRDQIGTASRELSRAFVLAQPEPDPATVASASLPDPPTIQPVLAWPLEPGKELLEPLVPANSQDSRDGLESNFRVTVEPVSGSRFQHVVRNIPLIGKRNWRTDYIPPSPLRNPALPSLPHRNIAQDINIDVKVYVTPSGKVEYSEVLSQVAETDRDLAALAMFSARRWEFVPARAGNVTVPGEVILHYRFGPGTRVAGNRVLAR